MRDVRNKSWLSDGGAGSLSLSIPPHGSVFLVLVPAAATWLEPFKLAPVLGWCGFVSVTKVSVVKI